MSSSLSFLPLQAGQSEQFEGSPQSARPPQCDQSKQSGAHDPSGQFEPSQPGPSARPQSGPFQQSQSGQAERSDSSQLEDQSQSGTSARPPSGQSEQLHSSESPDASEVLQASSAADLSRDAEVPSAAAPIAEPSQSVHLSERSADKGNGSSSAAPNPTPRFRRRRPNEAINAVMDEIVCSEGRAIDGRLVIVFRNVDDHDRPPPPESSV